MKDLAGRLFCLLCDANGAMAAEYSALPTALGDIFGFFDDKARAAEVTMREEDHRV